MIHAIAIDDEPIALEILRQHAAKIPFIKLTQTFASASEALVFIKSHPVQLIFLDIQMPDLNGIEFAAIINKSMPVVFTTAYPEYAVKGFELAAADYLLKPINFNRFLSACQRVYDDMGSSKMPKQYLFVKDGYELVRIDFNYLLLAEANSNYVTLYEKQKKTTTRITLTELLEKLPAEKFIRVNKSTIVAIDKIEKIDGNHLHINNIEIRISENYRGQFFKAIIQ